MYVPTNKTFLQIFRPSQIIGLCSGDKVRQGVPPLRDRVENIHAKSMEDNGLESLKECREKA